MIQQEGKNWTEVVARKLRESEAPVSDEMWRRLERDVFASSSPAGERLAGARRKNRIIRYTAAAAAILVCVSIGVRVLRIDHNVMEKGVVSVSETTVGGPHGGMDHTTGGSVPSSYSVPAEGPVARVGDQFAVALADARQRPEAGERYARAAAGQRQDGVTDRAEVVRSLSQPSELEPGVAAAAEPGEQPMAEAEHLADPSEMSGYVSPVSLEEGHRVVAEVRGESLAAEYEQLFAEPGSAVTRKRGVVSLFASGGWGGGSSAQGGGGGLSQIKALPMNTSQAVALQDGYESYAFDHRQPLSFGLNYRHEFRYGLSLETGVNYTLLRSNVALPGADARVHQQVHLLGVPVRVNWRFLQAGRFSMYVGAGTQVERCVSARFGNVRIPESAWLWSAAGALGAQYDLGRHVGIYFEPALSHYFTRTTLQTIYTDSPVVLDLRLGLRFSY